MNNIEELKEKVENVENMEETKQNNEGLGEEVPVEEMDQVTGGDNPFSTLRPTFMMGRGVKEVE